MEPYFGADNLPTFPGVICILNKYQIYIIVAAINYLVYTNMYLTHNEPRYRLFFSIILPMRRPSSRAESNLMRVNLIHSLS